MQSEAAVDRWRMVAVAAYFCAERRGFEPGGELDDWVRAEAEIDGLFAQLRTAGAGAPATAAGAPAALPM